VYEAGGVGGDVPTDMPRPLRVGQSVVARHPATRTAADGIVLTIKPSKYRVQFNRCVGRSRQRALGPRSYVHMQQLVSNSPCACLSWPLPALQHT
jgi:hypothetical protein